MSRFSATKLLGQAWMLLVGLSVSYLVLLAPGIRLWETGFNRIELIAVAAAYSCLAAAYFFSLIKNRVAEIAAGALATGAAVVLLTYVYTSSETFHQAINLKFDFLSTNWKVGIVGAVLIAVAGRLSESSNRLARLAEAVVGVPVFVFLIIYYIIFWRGFELTPLPANVANWIIGGAILYSCIFFNAVASQATGAIEKLGVIARGASIVVLIIFLAYIFLRDAAISRVASFVEFQRSSWGRSYSSVLIVALVGLAAYILRRTLRSTYGITEIIVGLVAVSLKARDTPDIILSPVGWLALVTIGAYLVVRGLDNFETGLTKEPRDPIATAIFGQSLDPVFRWLDDTKRFSKLKNVMKELLRP